MNMRNDTQDTPGLEDIRSEIFKMRASIEERGPYLSFGVVVLALIGFAWTIWIAYPHAEGGDVSVAAVPLVRADTTPIRRAPDDPGGMTIPFQDSTVFDRLEDGEPAANKVENLLETTPSAPPREPAAKPQDITLEGAKSIMIKEETGKVGTEKQAVEYIPPKPKVKPQTKPVANPAPVQPAPAPVAGGVLIQLGSLTSREDAEKEWARLRKRYSDELSNLNLDIQRVDLGAKGVYYRVRGGMLPPEKARDICAKLKTDNPGGCILVDK